MSTQTRPIDCDVHPTVPDIKALVPYLDPFWQDSVTGRGITSLDSQSYPPNAPISARHDFRNGNGLAATDHKKLAAQVFDRWQAGIAICNCIYGVQLPFNEDMGAAFARALNSWIAKEWLDRDPRLRASIAIGLQNVEHAVDEIERCAGDRRFVQVLVLAMGEAPLGKRQYWPIFAAAERHDLPIGIHAGSAWRHPVTSSGWPSYYLEDYTAQSQGFQSQLGSLICEGVFAKFPKLKVVLLESGVTWLPAFLWRLSKLWRGVRQEVPWVDRPPEEVVRAHVRMTIQPFDAPETGDTAQRAIEHLRSDDILLYASDFPHWQFDGDAVIPPGISDTLARKIKVDNPLATYPRLQERSP